MTFDQFIIGPNQGSVFIKTHSWMPRKLWLQSQALNLWWLMVTWKTMKSICKCGSFKIPKCQITPCLSLLVPWLISWKLSVGKRTIGFPLKRVQNYSWHLQCKSLCREAAGSLQDCIPHWQEASSIKCLNDDLSWKELVGNKYKIPCS